MNTRTQLPGLRPFSFSRNTAIARSIILAAALLPAQSFAATHTWTNTSGDTNWATITNWNPNGAPQAGDIALITGGPSLPVGATWTVTDNVAAGPILNSLTISHTNSKLNFASNVLNVGNSTFFPSLSTATEMIGDGSTGAKGYGTLNLAGGFNIVSSNLTLGNLSTDNGFYNLSGASALQAPRENIAEGGFGTFTQSNGTNTLTSPSVTPELVIGDLAGSIGNYNLQGGSLLNHSGIEFIGIFGNGTFTQTGGINAPDSGTNITNTVDVGFLTGSGTYNMQGGTLTTVGFNIGGNSGNGTVNHSAGNVNLTLQAGTAPVLYLGVGINGIASYNLSNAANLSVLQGVEYVGYSNGSLGTFTQTGGNNTLNNQSGFPSYLYVGVSPTSTGNYSLSNGSLSLTTGVEYVGYGGNGTFFQNGGTHLLASSAYLSIATLPGSVGNFILTGGSLSAPSIYIGGDLSSPGGTGTLTFNSPATLNVSVAISLLPGGTFTGNGTTSAAVINNGGILSPGSTIGTLTIGSLFANTGARFAFDPADLLVVSGTVNLAGPSGIFLNGPFTNPVPLISYGSLAGSSANLAFFGGTTGRAYTAVNDAANHLITFTSTSLGRYAKTSVTGDPSPDGTQFYIGVGPGAVNTAGQVAFFSDMDAVNVGVMRLDSTGYVLIAQLNQSAPGVGGGTISTFINSHDNINAAGQVAFRAGLANTIDGSTEGVFRGDGTSLVPIARTQQVLPSGGGTITSLGFLTTPLVNQAGQVAVLLHLASATDGAVSGIFRGNGSSLTPIARNHQAAPGFGGGFFDATFGAQAGFDDEPILNNSAQVAFIALLTGAANGSNVGYFRGDGTTLSSIARLGQLAPGSGGGTYSLLNSNFAFNDAGQLAFGSYLTGTSDGSQAGIFRGDGATTVVIARHKLAAPGAGGGQFDSDLRVADMNAAGQVAFSATLTGTTDGSSAGYFRSDGTTLIPLARNKQLAPGAGGATFALDYVNYHPRIAPGGQVAFVTPLAGTPDGLSSDLAIYMTDGQDLIPVAMTGQTLPSSTFTGTIGNGLSIGTFNSFGQLPWSVLYTNNYTGNFLFTPTLHWRSPSSGNWDAVTNWTLGLAPAHVHDVLIDPATSLTVTGPATNTTIQSLTIGTGGANATLHLAAGNLKIAGPLTLAGSTNNWSALVDIAGAKLAIEATPATKSTALATLRNQVAYAKTHAAGITSTGLPSNLAIAIIDNGAIATPFTLFGGLPVDSNSLLLAPELLGDANIDGHVNLLDLNTVLQNFGATTPNWTSGNFDGQPTINLSDLAAVLNNFGAVNLSANSDELPMTNDGLLTWAPEPASLVPLFAGIFPLLRRSSRFYSRTFPASAPN